MSKLYPTRFALKDQVHIDGSSDLVGVVTVINLRETVKGEVYCQYEVSWFANGVAQSGYFDGWRLFPVEDKP